MATCLFPELEQRKLTVSVEAPPALSHAIRAYAAALGRHWVSLMGGAVLGVGLPLAEKLTGIELPAAVYGGLALLCVLVATFQAWREQYERASHVEAEPVRTAASPPSSVDPEVARRKRVFAMAIDMLRATHGEMFKTSNGATSGLPGVLWYKKQPAWEKIVERLGEVERVRGRFRPFIEPSVFNGSDDTFVAAAEELLRLYLWGSENHPDFEAIRTKFALPQADNVRKLLDGTADPLAPRDYREEHGILWGVAPGEALARPFCVGCYTANRKWVPMSASDVGPTHAKVREFTCPHGHPQIVLTLDQLATHVGATSTVLRAVMTPWEPPKQ
jgi:hypothetical protein